MSKGLIYDGIKDGEKIQVYIGGSSGVHGNIQERGIELLVIEQLSPERTIIELEVPKEQLKDKFEKAASGSLQTLEGVFNARYFVPGGGRIPREMPYDSTETEEDLVTDLNRWYDIPIKLIMDGQKEIGKIDFNYELAPMRDWKHTSG
jgi:hypothetical protein